MKEIIEKNMKHTRFLKRLKLEVYSEYSPFVVYDSDDAKVNSCRVKLIDPQCNEFKEQFIDAGTTFFRPKDILKLGSKLVLFLLVMDAYFYKSRQWEIIRTDLAQHLRQIGLCEETLKLRRKKKR